jgi:hypothetical protein
MNTYIVTVTGIWESVAEFRARRYQVKAETPGMACDKCVARHAATFKDELYSVLAVLSDDDILVIDEKSL